MKALVFHGKGKISWETKAMPRVQRETDVVLRMRRTTICGTDLHILHGNVPTCLPGTTLGHEGIGTVVEKGAAVSRHAVGDQVLVSCISGCGICPNCARGFVAHCSGGGGWLLGNTIDGCQAEYVRVPLADHSVHALPPQALAEPDPFVMLSDILPTGLEVGVREGQVAAGRTVAVVGAGPVGLAAVMTAASYQPAQVIVVDRDAHRLGIARELGATHIVDNSDGAAAKRVMELTQGRGVDTAIECIGLPVGWQVCEDVVAAGGNIAVLGVHGRSVTLHLERMWHRNFTLTAGLVHTSSIPALMQRVLSGELNPALLISHTFKLSDAVEAYTHFGNAASTKSLKVILRDQ